MHHGLATDTFLIPLDSDLSLKLFQRPWTNAVEPYECIFKVLMCSSKYTRPDELDHKCIPHCSGKQISIYIPNKGITYKACHSIALFTYVEFSQWTCTWAAVQGKWEIRSLK